MGSPTFGERFADLRRSSGLTLSEFCGRNSFDIGYVSKMERGVLPPPASDEKLQEYAKALGLVEGSDEWDGFVDAARLERGEIPRDVLESEDAKPHLLLLFRTLRGKQLSEEQIAELVARLKHL